MIVYERQIQVGAPTDRLALRLPLIRNVEQDTTS